MRALNTIKNPKKNILFLGYDETQTKIIDSLINKECQVAHTAEIINGINTINGYDLVVSYGYRHIISADMIKSLACPIFNLHIAYLPYNRGAHPNFWSFYDNTPSGVTIHLVDDGIDTGPIVVQEYVNFSEDDDTFIKTYKALNARLEDVFIGYVDKILTGEWEAKKQRGLGSHHYASDLPQNFAGWHANIDDEIKKLDIEGLRYE
ncbi:formyltransferase family protein [Marinagarivorans algicola]|uniref:formyltransferase family protein n=1 Tax=Marinagarivorans algicola TaxID=1513270 RepID=UPI0006B45EFF|nr:formyltransferase family protein [Marinagarivorans algicola]